MKKIKSLTLELFDLPESLKQIPTPPSRLYVLGEGIEDLLKRPRLAVVGSRKVSAYGRTVTDQLVSSVASRGVVIVSGLAIGVDGLAHQAALAAGGHTIAVLGSGLDQVYPASHYQLARNILEHGGLLVSEYPEGTPPLPQHFIARNRLISGLSQAVLITEAAAKSGTLHTANFALEQGREVLAVPGNITSVTSGGTNNLIKAGAQPITGVEDVLAALGLSVEVSADTDTTANNEAEDKMLRLIKEGVSDVAELQLRSALDAAAFNQTLTMLEISGRIRHRGSGQWSLS